MIVIPFRGGQRPLEQFLADFGLHLTVKERARERERKGGVSLVGGEGGGSECEEGEAFSVSVSPACCRLQNEHSCFPLGLRGNCCF